VAKINGLYEQSVFFEIDTAKNVYIVLTVKTIVCDRTVHMTENSYQICLKLARKFDIFEWRYDGSYLKMTEYNLQTF
jgi:hypothetical protein